jgi:hypothetical protein
MYIVERVLDTLRQTQQADNAIPFLRPHLQINLTLKPQAALTTLHTCPLRAGWFYYTRTAIQSQHGLP